MKFSLRPAFKYRLVILWLLNTLALAGWLYIFSFRQTQKIAEIKNESSEVAAAYHRMLISESLVLSVSLLLAGFFLVYYIYIDVKRTKKVRSFFLRFSHELKTPLTSLQLQAENLLDDLGSSEHKEVIHRLVADTNRLSFHLENSLALAEGDERNLFLEDIDLENIIMSLKHYWPELKLSINQTAIVKMDKRSLESIFKNIIENAIKHGEATEVRISVSQQSDNQVLVKVADNGSGFKGDRKTLGVLLERQSSSSGSGVGLYLVSELTKQTGGSVLFPESESGFVVQLSLPRGAI